MVVNCSCIWAGHSNRLYAGICHDIQTIGICPASFTFIRLNNTCSFLSWTLRLQIDYFHIVLPNTASQNLI
jgi:hypothetical protein